MIRTTNIPNPMIRPQNTLPESGTSTNRQSGFPQTPDEIGRDASNFANRQSAYAAMGVRPEVEQPPPMPTPRDLDSEKIAYSDSDKFSVAHNPPVSLARLQNPQPFSADHITQPIASGSRTSVYDALGVEPHQPPGVPTPRDLDSEKIVYSDSEKFSVAHNPPVASARPQNAQPFSADHITQPIASGSRSSVYDALGVEPHQPPGVPTPRDLDSEKIVYSDSDKFSVAHNPPVSVARLQNPTPFSADHITQPIASGPRASVYDALGVAPHQPPGVPTPRDLDSEKIAYSDSDKFSVAHNPPVSVARLQNPTPFSADHITQPIASGSRTSVYDALGVEPHQPPGVPTARDLDSEKIVTQGENHRPVAANHQEIHELDSTPIHEIGSR